jgi:hypothetical protein
VKISQGVPADALPEPVALRGWSQELIAVGGRRDVLRERIAWKKG